MEKKFNELKVSYQIVTTPNCNKCKGAVNEDPINQIISFDTFEEAEAYLKSKAMPVDNCSGQNDLIVYCDGSYDDILKRYSYGVVMIDQDGNETSLSGSGNDFRYLPSRNVAGEVFGALAGLEQALRSGYRNVRLCYDYTGVENWATGKWAANAEISQMYQNAYRQLISKGLKVTFEKVKSHSGNLYNDQADALAKKALFTEN
ncbi:RNase H [anaerobic digester metagenome]